MARYDLDPRRWLAEARAANAKARRYADMSGEPEDDWDIDTLVDRIDALEKRPPLPSAPELEFAGPGGIKARIVGLSPGWLVLAIALVGFAFGLIWMAR
jgi:hypothetical protein